MKRREGERQAGKNGIKEERREGGKVEGKRVGEERGREGRRKGGNGKAQVDVIGYCLGCSCNKMHSQNALMCGSVPLDG